MRKLLMILLGLMTLGLASADQAQMNNTLVRMVNQIDAMMPLIDEAKLEQAENPRIKFHFDKFIGTDGHMHPGLRQDLMTIRMALVAQINRPAITPRVVTPLNKDFVGR